MTATLQILPVNSFNGSTFMTAHLILTTPCDSQEKPKPILPKLPTPEQLKKKESSNDISSTTNFDGSSVKTERNLSSESLCRLKKKSFTKSGYPKPSSMQKRNARERNRVKQVNQGFVTLANHVPDEMRPKKMSKVETLKTAIKYIAHLKSILGNSVEMPDFPSDLGDDFALNFCSEENNNINYASQPTDQYTIPSNNCGMQYPVNYNYERNSYNSPSENCGHYFDENYSPSAGSQSSQSSFLDSPFRNGNSLCSPTPSHSSTSSTYDNLSLVEGDLMDFQGWI